MTCLDGASFLTFEQALASKRDEPMGAHAFRCVQCRGWHVKSNVARNWLLEPLRGKPGRKTASTPVVIEDDE
jgi:hypothetical protein